MVQMTTSNSAVVTLPTDTQILITREFDAPRNLVYRAYTTPELIRRWWSGERGEVTSAEVDLRPGGTWRYLAVRDDRQRRLRGRIPRRVPGDRAGRAHRHHGCLRGHAGRGRADHDHVRREGWPHHGVHTRGAHHTGAPRRPHQLGQDRKS